MRAPSAIALWLALGIAGCADAETAPVVARAEPLAAQGENARPRPTRVPGTPPERLAEPLPRPSRAPSPGASIPDAEPAARPPEAPPPHGFSWIDEDVGGMAWPGTGADLAASLDWLAAHGVGLVVTLTEASLDEDALAVRALAGLHLPVADFTAPTIAQLDAFVGAAEAAIADGRKVAVHCLGGHGRTGTMLAAWLIAGGDTADVAIARVRALRPGSIETESQLAILRAYADR